jgi:hypothetical protein
MNTPTLSANSLEIDFDMVASLARRSVVGIAACVPYNQQDAPKREAKAFQANCGYCRKQRRDTDVCRPRIFMV